MKKFKNFCKNYYCIYTIVFSALCLILFSYYYLNQRTFINHTNDGLIQHYKALVYYSDYLRTIFRNLFVEHRFLIPQWDFSIGEGSDILQTLHMYAIGDPLSFFSVLFPREKIYVYYDLSIIIRLYLSGIVFSGLCFYTKRNNKYGVLAGALVYVFCYWSLWNVNEHIYFLNPMIYLPMIVLGVEKIIREDKPYLLTIAVFISAISNFYFFYMLVVLTVIYVAVRLLNEYGKDVRMICFKLKKVFIFSVLGTLMASVILFPVLKVFVSDNRASTGGSTDLLYSRFYYERLFTAFLSNDLQYDLAMGYAAPTLLSLGLILKEKRKTGKMLRIFFAVALLIVCLPIAGKIMNGFAYPINRWSFAIALITAYSLVYEWDDLASNGKYLLLWMVAVFLTSMISAWSRQMRVFVPILFCILFYIVVVYGKTRICHGIELKQNILILIMIFNICYIADFDYSARGSNRLENAATKNEAVSEIEDSDAQLLSSFLKEANKETLARYSGDYLKVNAAMLAKTYSTDFYWSLTNPYVISYREKLGLNDFTSYLYRGYDDRALLYTLANVRYYVSSNGRSPFGFEGPVYIEGIDVYENRNYIPFGYTYKNTLSYETWDELDQIKKQEVLSDHIVIEKGNEKIDRASSRLDFELIPEEGVTIEQNKLIVTTEKAVLHLKIDGLKSGEYNLSFDGLNFTDTESYIEGNRTWVRIKTAAGDVKKDIYFFTKDYQFYSGRHDFTVCYGYQEEGLDEIVLTLPYPGIYTFDDLYISCVDEKEHAEKIRLLKEDVLENLEIGVNRVEGMTNLKEDKYLLLSIPYSDGWKALVDGAPKQILRANECYMALKLDKGEHSIVLKYETPFLKQGAFISVLTSMIFTAFSLLNKRK